MTALVEQVRVLRALVVRDLMMRYGREAGGFLWAILEPMILCVGVTVVWSLMKPAYEHGILLAAMVLTGYMNLTLWRHLTGSAVHLLRRNNLLFFHRGVSTLDLFWSRQVLEFTATSAAFLVVYLAMLSLKLVEPIYDWSLCALAWISMAFLACAASLIFTIATESYEWAEKLVQPFQYLLIPISGTFFMLEWLPSEARAFFWWNPLIHINEMMRAGFVGSSVTTFWDWWYPWVFGTVVFAVGGFGVARARRNVYV